MLSSVIRNSARKLGFSPAHLVPRMMSSSPVYKFDTLKVSSPSEFVQHVELNRPEKLNAMNNTFFKEVQECFQQLAQDVDCRVVVLSANGKHFTAGLDLQDAASMFTVGEEDVGRKSMQLRQIIQNWQESFNAIEKCHKPVIAAIHGACIGGGVDMTTACDIRMCTKDAYFSVKEVDIGIAADLGTLQRLPKVVGSESLARELCFTARKLPAAEAKECGMVSRVFDDKSGVVEGALEMAKLIASKSPVAVQGTKVSMVYSRDHSVDEGMKHIGVWNQSFLQSEDVMKAAMASMTKQEAKFSKL